FGTLSCDGSSEPGPSFGVCLTPLPRYSREYSASRASAIRSWPALRAFGIFGWAYLPSTRRQRDSRSCLRDGGMNPSFQQAIDPERLADQVGDFQRQPHLALVEV